jgi:hypothetical protein
MSLFEDDDGAARVNDSIQKLSDAWRTELSAPEILPYKDDLVEEMKEILKNQEVYAIIL